MELARPLVFDASLLAAVVVDPRAGAAWVVLVGVDVAGWAEVAGFVPPMLKRLGALLVAVAAPDEAGAELPPPTPENSDEDGAVVVVAPAAAVVVVAPLEAGVLAGVEAAGLPKLKRELPPVDVPVPEVPENRLLVGAAEDVGVVELFPPKLNEAMPEEDGCEEAGAAGVFPRLNVGGLLAGVAEGVELPRENNGLDA